MTVSFLCHVDCLACFIPCHPRSWHGSSAHVCQIQPNQKQAKAGAASKNGTFVGDRRVDGVEGIPLNDGDVLGLGFPATANRFNPYNLVVGDVDLFLEAVRIKACGNPCVRCGKMGHATKECAEVMVKHEQHGGRIGMEPMDVDAPGTSGVVDLTLDSDVEGDVRAGREGQRDVDGRVSITLTDSPPSWYKDGYTYQFMDRKLITPSRVAMKGQLQGDEIKLTTAPREFLLDVKMQNVVKDIVVKSVIEGCKKMYISGNSEVRAFLPGGD